MPARKRRVLSTLVLNISLNISGHFSDSGGKSIGAESQWEARQRKEPKTPRKNDVNKGERLENTILPRLVILSPVARNVMELLIIV